MKLILVLLGAFVLLGCPACHSVKEKTKILAERADGITLQTERVEYFFMPEAVRAAINAKKHYVSAAVAEAAKRGKQIKTVKLVDADIERRELSGTYLSSITGYVGFGGGWDGMAQDQSPLFSIASSSESSSNKKLGMLAGVSASVSAANQQIAQSAAANQQAIQMSQINSSIQANTNAVNGLNRSVGYQPYQPAPAYRALPTYRITPSYGGGYRATPY